MRLAVLGPRARVTLLEAMCEDVEASFDDLLDRLIEAGLLVEESDGQVVSFPQALIARPCSKG